ncbi:hypothetical protein [Maribacter polysaccharolyticus]|uniref:hypothetical protein n=1 Tax=Maribacter polysaccharolyticus TaxID=3020831 RepID=UPI00237F4DD9|nr:hypothetical protein [Maribacter polysaccharolyticus]MDE3742567.1 hypothetical protein [Maribacter polysaccharolyticus]
MENTDNLLREIAKLTTKMETDYPELYRYLDETPITLPIELHPKIDKNELEGYLDSLQELLRNYLKSHKKVNGIT